MVRQWGSRRKSRLTDQHVLQFDIVVEDALAVDILVGGDDLLLQLPGNVWVRFAPADRVGEFYRQ